MEVRDIFALRKAGRIEEAYDLIREKYKNLRISPRVKALVDGLSLSKEEVDDERTKYMLGI